jgi:hypothetical protein
MAFLPIEVDEQETVEVLLAADVVLVLYGATQIVVTTKVPDKLEGMEASYILFLGTHVAKGAILLNHSRYILSLAIHSGREQPAIDKEGTRCCEGREQGSLMSTNLGRHGRIGLGRSADLQGGRPHLFDPSRFHHDFLALPGLSHCRPFSFLAIH